MINAVKNNDVALTKQLIEKGADVNERYRVGRTALYCACNRGFVECTKMLLEANANMDTADNYGYTPLHMASLNGHTECVKLLVERKANVKAKSNSGESPLHLAAREGYLVCIEMLIQSDVLRELDARDNYGDTPIVHAILNYHRDAVELLLDKGAKMINIHPSIEIPKWVNRLLEKRHKVKLACLTLYGVLRRRSKIGKDMSKEVSQSLWSTRFDKKWK